MNDEIDDMRTIATEALAGMRTLMAMIESGSIDATASQTWHLRGAIDAIDALLNGRSVTLIDDEHL
jgi:hypothetical protein